MIQKLSEIYPTLVEVKDVTQQSYNNYKWFRTKENKNFEIPHDDLTEKDISLLSMFLDEYNDPNFFKTTTEKLWYKRIFEKTNSSSSYPFRFVYFTIQQDHIEPKTFKEAIDELFGKCMPILWDTK